MLYKIYAVLPSGANTFLGMRKSLKQAKKVFDNQFNPNYSYGLITEHARKNSAPISILKINSSGIFERHTGAIFHLLNPIECHEIGQNFDNLKMQEWLLLTIKKYPAVHEYIKNNI